jgi:hypothetical protein
MELHAEQIAAWVAEQERRLSPRITLIESAGGAFSPLATRLTNVDLALALEPALWVLVAPDALGVLHDVTSTLRALPRPPDAIVLSSARAADASTGSNAAELTSLDICEVREVLSPGASSAPELARWLLAHPTYKKSTRGESADRPR